MINRYIEVIKERFDVEIKDEFDGNHYFANKKMLILLVEPHSGTEYKYCLRADFPETFDRWSVCLFDELFSNDEFDNKLLELDSFVKRKELVLKEELENN